MTEERTNYAVTAPKPNKFLPKLGIAISAVWVGGMVVYAVLNSAKMIALEPNALGDFLAGTFAPLAFLWLVLGFFQQGEELRHSGQALWLQGRELQNSVEQQRELVNVTREQLKFDSEVLREQQAEIARSALPQIRLRLGGNSPEPATPGSRRYDFRLLNVGKQCTDVRIDIAAARKSFDVPLLSASVLPFEFSLVLPTSGFAPFLVRVDFRDERSVPGCTTFQVAFEGHAPVVSDVAT